MSSFQVPIPTSTPISTPLIEPHNLTSYSIYLQYFLIGYLISTFICFIYLLMFRGKSMSFISKFFSSFIVPFAFVAILIRNTLIFIFSMLFQAFIIIFIHIIHPILYGIFIFIIEPTINTIEYIYNHTKIIWTMIAKALKCGYDVICDFVHFIIEKIVFRIIKFIFVYIFQPILEFLVRFIFDPLFNEIILPLCNFISKLPAFKAIVEYITDAYIAVYEFCIEVITAIAKVCETIINGISEMIKEAYEQAVLPFVQLVKRIFGE